jgi:hypothetical protein
MTRTLLFLMMLSFFVFISGCNTEWKPTELFYESENINVVAKGFTIDQGSIRYLLSFKVTGEIPNGSIARITYENLDPCKNPITTEVPVILSGDLWVVESPGFKSAKLNTAYAVSAWIFHDGIVISHNVELVEIDFPKKIFDEAKITAITKCITSATNTYAPLTATPQSGAH